MAVPVRTVHVREIAQTYRVESIVERNHPWPISYNQFRINIEIGADCPAEVVVEEPEGGWPWRIKFVWATAVPTSHRGQPRYKIKCKWAMPIDFGLGR